MELATADTECPVATAIALRVSVLLTLMVVEYLVDDVVGVEPLVV
jgi:hypothetical protein